MGFPRTFSRKEQRQGRLAGWLGIVGEKKATWFGESPSSPSPQPPTPQGSCKLWVCTGQELGLHTWLGDNGHPHSGQGEAVNNRARTGFRQPATGLRTETWSGWFTWWCSTLVNEDRPRRSLGDSQEDLALVLGSNHTLDILCAREFPFLSVHSKRLGLTASFGPWGGQVRALKGSLAQKPWRAQTPYRCKETRTLFPRKGLPITTPPPTPRRPLHGARNSILRRLQYLKRFAKNMK